MSDLSEILRFKSAPIPPWLDLTYLQRFVGGIGADENLKISDKSDINITCIWPLLNLYRTFTCPKDYIDLFLTMFNNSNLLQSYVFLIHFNI